MAGIDNVAKIREIINREYEERWETIMGRDLRDQPVNGDLRINNLGKIEEFHEGYWMETGRDK